MASGFAMETTSPHSDATLSPAGHRIAGLKRKRKSGSGQRHHVDLVAIEGAVRTILAAVGEDPLRPGLLDTPRRVARMYAEMFAGLNTDPARHLHVTFPEDYDEMVMVRDIPFTSMCEHHLLPFSGVAHVAYTSVVVYTREDGVSDNRYFAHRRDIGQDESEVRCESDTAAD